MTYQSAPAPREGESIDKLASEAIDATANATTTAAAEASAHSVRHGSAQEKIRLLTLLVVAEAIVIVALLAGWVIL